MVIKILIILIKKVERLKNQSSIRLDLLSQYCT